MPDRMSERTLEAAMDQTLKHGTRLTGRHDSTPPAGTQRRPRPQEVRVKREFSLAHLTVMGCPPPEMIYVAARAGYDYVSLRTIFMGLPGEPNYALATNPALRKMTRHALESTGVRLHDIELARVKDGVEPRSYLPEFEVAAELGARAVLSSIWSADRAFYLDQFAEICDLAQPFGLTVDLESVPVAAVRNLASAVDVLHTVKRGNAGLMIDTHHFHRARDQAADLGAVPREWFHFAQICDAPAEIPADREEMIHVMREARLYLGEGGIDVAGILRQIPRVPYSIELPHLDRAHELGYAEHAFRCLESAKTYLAAHAAEFAA
jgi:sugar phosphate isomerase/epimerase